MAYFLTDSKGTSTWRGSVLAGLERNWVTAFLGYYNGSNFVVSGTDTFIDSIEGNYSTKVTSELLLGYGATTFHPYGIAVRPYAEWDGSYIRAGVRVSTRGDTVDRQYVNRAWSGSVSSIQNNALDVWVNVDVELIVPWATATLAHEELTHINYFIDPDQQILLKLTGTWKAVGQKNAGGSKEVDVSGTINETINLSAAQYKMWGDFGWKLGAVYVDARRESHNAVDETYTASIDIPGGSPVTESNVLANKYNTEVNIDGPGSRVSVRCKHPGNLFRHNGIPWWGSRSYTGDRVQPAVVGADGGYSVSRQRRSYTIDTSDIKMVDGTPADLSGVQIALKDGTYSRPLTVPGLVFDAVSPQAVTYNGEYHLGAYDGSSNKYTGRLRTYYQVPDGTFITRAPDYDIGDTEQPMKHGEDVPKNIDGGYCHNLSPVIDKAICDSKGWAHDIRTVWNGSSYSTIEYDRLLKIPVAGVTPVDAFRINYDPTYDLSIYNYVDHKWYWSGSNCSISDATPGIDITVGANTEAVSAQLEFDLGTWESINIGRTINGMEGTFRFLDLGVDWSSVTNTRAAILVTLGSGWGDPDAKASWLLKHGQSVIDLANPTCHPDDGPYCDNDFHQWGNCLGRTLVDDYDSYNYGSYITSIELDIRGASVGDILRLRTVKGVFYGGELAFGASRDDARHGVEYVLCHKGLPSVVQYGGDSNSEYKWPLDRIFTLYSPHNILRTTSGDPTAYVPEWNPTLPVSVGDTDRILCQDGSALSLTKVSYFFGVDDNQVYPHIFVYTRAKLHGYDIDVDQSVNIGEWIKVRPLSQPYSKSRYVVGDTQTFGTPDNNPIVIRIHERIGWYVHGVSIRNRRHASTHFSDKQISNSFMVESDLYGVYNSKWISDIGDVNSITTTPAPSATIWMGVNRASEISGEIGQDTWHNPTGDTSKAPESSVSFVCMWSAGVPDPVDDPVAPTESQRPSLPDTQSVPPLPPPPVEPPLPPPPEIPPPDVKKHVYIPDDTLYRRVVTALCVPGAELLSFIRTLSDNQTPVAFHRETEWYVWRADYVVSPLDETVVIVDGTRLRKAQSDWDFFNTSDPVWLPAEFAEPRGALTNEHRKYVYMRNIESVTSTIPCSGGATPVALVSEVHPDSPIWYLVPEEYRAGLPPQFHWMQVEPRNIINDGTNLVIDLPYGPEIPEITVRYRSAAKFDGLESATVLVNDFTVPVDRLPYTNRLDDIAQLYTLFRNEQEGNTALASRLIEQGIITSIDGRRSPTFALANALDLVTIATWEVSALGGDPEYLDLTGFGDVTDIWLPVLPEVESISEPLVAEATTGVFVVPSKRVVEPGYNIYVGDNALTGVDVVDGIATLPGGAQSPTIRYLARNYRIERDSDGRILRLATVPGNTPAGRYLVVSTRSVKVWEPGNTDYQITSLTQDQKDTLTQLTIAANKAAPVSLGAAKWSDGAVWFDDSSPTPVISHAPVQLDGSTG